MTSFETCPRSHTDSRLILYSGGVPSSTVFSRAVRRGDLLRVRTGVYVESGVWGRLPPWERYRLAVLADAASDDDAVMCREAALLVRDLPLISVPPFVCTRARRRKEVGWQRAATVTAGVPRTRRIEAALRRGITREELRTALHSGGAALPAEAVHLTCADGGQARTWADPLMLNLIDTVPRMSRDAGVVVLDAAMRRWRQEGQVIDQGLWAGWADHLRPRRHEALCRDRWRLADPGADSLGESISRMRLRAWGFPEPTLQKRFVIEGREIYVDFWWEEFGVIGEFDGRAKYRSEEMRGGLDAVGVVVEEKEREDLLRSTGARVGRWGWHDLGRFDGVAARLTRLGLPRLGSLGGQLRG